jgi:hypothetical protein
MYIIEKDNRNFKIFFGRESDCIIVGGKAEAEY